MTRARRPAAPAWPRKKLVLMNPGARPGQVPRPTVPVDDFSIALFAFAELALEKSGLEVAQIGYWMGRPVHNLYDEKIAVHPSHTVAQVLLYPDADRYLQARKEEAWTPSAIAFDIQANGIVQRRQRVRGLGYTDFVTVGNLLRWRFNMKKAFTPPPELLLPKTPLE